MLLVALALTLVAVMPAAADVSDPAQRQPDTVRTFDRGSDVDGDVERPEGARIHLRSGAQRETLTRPRANFVPEKLNSVQNL